MKTQNKKPRIHRPPQTTKKKATTNNLNLTPHSPTVSPYITGFPRPIKLSTFGYPWRMSNDLV